MFEGLYSLEENINPIPMLAADLLKIRDDYVDLRK